MDNLELDDNSERCAAALSAITGSEWKVMRDEVRPVYARDSFFILMPTGEWRGRILLRAPHGPERKPAWAFSATAGDLFDYTADSFMALIGNEDALRALGGGPIKNSEPFAEKEEPPKRSHTFIIFGWKVTIE